MIDLDNRTDKNYDFERLGEIASSLTPLEIELILTDNTEIAQINLEFRGIDKPTDVLSFPTDPFPGAPLGTIIISVDKVAQAATQLGHNENDELSLLFIHGLLHLLGMDHETDGGEMRAKEEKIVREFNLPLSLIVRTQGLD
ncbi:MAG: putative rRNA maturation factor [Campylobacterota bacterium]|nr:putative rRNA maturation factor [Campylobacterota bacterium]